MTLDPGGDRHIPNQTPVSTPGSDPETDRARAAERARRASTIARWVTASSGFILVLALLATFSWELLDLWVLGILFVVVLVFWLVTVRCLGRADHSAGGFGHVSTSASTQAAPSSPAQAGSDQAVGVDDRTFRFDVDASFDIAGRGTVATGKVTIGSVSVGTDIVVMRDGVEAVRSRVVGIKMSRKTGEVAGAGDEAGLLLADIPRSAVRKGDRIVVAPAACPGQ